MKVARLRARFCGIAFGLLIASMVGAHPLGNATVNRQAQIKIDSEQVKIDYLLDLAEIPTLVAAQDADADSDGTVSAAEWKAYAGRWAQLLQPQLALSLDGRALGLVRQNVAWSLTDGAANLKQLKLRARYAATLPLPHKQAVLAYRDASRPQEAGWREIWTAAGTGARLVASDVAQTDRSQGLTRFPTDGSAFPEEIAARVVIAFLPPVAPVAVPPVAQERIAPPADATPVGSAPTFAPALPGAGAFFRLGMHHIASGWDHLVFLFGLLLFSQTLGQVLKIVSTFTLAHSVTLGLASAGMVTPPGALVEPAIALSIAYVGLANLLWRHRAHGVAVAFGFGLVHGFGFAGALAESLGNSLAGQSIGSKRWLLDLAAFNLGIEAFQVALLCVMVPLLRRMERFDWSVLARRSAALAVLGTGLSWFALRVLMA